MGATTNVNSFQARDDLLRPAVAEATTLDVEQGANQTGQATSSALTALGSTPTMPPDRPRRLLLSGLGMGQAAEVQRYAQAVVDRAAWAIVADGELNTVAYGGVLRAKQVVLVRGVGRQFSGQYYVERVLHVIKSDGSYTQRFTLRRNALGLRGNERFASGTAPAL
jgi:phage protein D